mgnify:CR=1 FL=1
MNKMDKNGFGVHVIATGDPASGFELIGPFSNEEEAIEWADRFLDTYAWWALPLVGQDSVADEVSKLESLAGRSVTKGGG